MFRQTSKRTNKRFCKTEKKTNELKAFGGISSDKANLWF